MKARGQRAACSLVGTPRQEEGVSGECDQHLAPDPRGPVSLEAEGIAVARGVPALPSQGKSLGPPRPLVSTMGCLSPGVPRRAGRGGPQTHTLRGGCLPPPSARAPGAQSRDPPLDWEVLRRRRAEWRGLPRPWLLTAGHHGGGGERCLCPERWLRWEPAHSFYRPRRKWATPRPPPLPPLSLRCLPPGQHQRRSLFPFFFF